MIRFTHLVRIAALAAGVALGAPATAATITLDMPLCNSFTVVGNTLTCETGTVPTCQIAGPTSGTIGAAVTLTATCTNGPITGYTWIGCIGAGNTCTLNPPNPGPFPVTVVAANAQGPGAQAAYTVTFSNTPAVAPTGCSVTATPSTVATAGGTTNLSVACTGGGAATSFAWSGAGVVAVNAAATTAVVSATTQYSVVVNGSTTASRTVTVGTGGGGGGSCAGLTTQDFNAIDFDGTNLHFDLGKGDRDVAIFSYTAQATDIGKVADLNVVEHGSGIHYYTVWASKTRCDMTSATRISSTTSPTVFVSVSGNQVVNMQPGETWYFMIRNWSSTGKNTCSDNTCGTLVSKHLWR